MKKLNAILAIAAVAALAFTGCSKPASSSTTAEATSTVVSGEKDLSGSLVLWSQWNDVEAQGIVLQQIADEFMEEYPDVDIEIQFNGRDINKTLKPALESGEVIDIFDFPANTAVEDYALDLTEYVKEVYPTTDGVAFEETLMPALLELPKAQTKSNGELLAVGYQPWMCSFMYNDAIFTELGIEAPSTWEELDAACAKIKEAGYSPITFDDAYAPLLPGMYLAREKGEDFIVELINDKTGELWKDESVKNMAKAFEDFAQKGYFDAGISGNKWPAGQNDVGNGKVAMYYNATWLPNELVEITGEDFKWGAFTFPDVVSGETKSKTEEACGSGMISIAKDSKNPDLAMEFITFMFSKNNDQLMAMESTGIPATKNAEWPETLVEVKPAFENIDTMLKWAGGIDGNADVTPILNENFTKLAAGQITSDQFVEAMANGTKA